MQKYIRGHTAKKLKGGGVTTLDQPLTKNGWLLVGTEIVVDELKEDPQFFCEESGEGLVVLLPHQTVREHSEALVDPES